MKYHDAIARLAARVFSARVTEVAASVACALFLVGLPLFSQINTGRILGTVTDPTGGVIAGAMVTVTNPQTGVARDSFCVRWRDRNFLPPYGRSEGVTQTAGNAHNRW